MPHSNQFEVVTFSGEKFNCTIKEIHEMVASGKLTRNCRIRRKGVEKWTIAKKVKGLRFPDEAKKSMNKPSSNQTTSGRDDIESTIVDDLDPRLKSWMDMTVEAVVGEMNRTEEKS